MSEITVEDKLDVQKDESILAAQVKQFADTIEDVEKKLTK